MAKFVGPRQQLPATGWALRSFGLPGSRSHIRDDKAAVVDSGPLGGGRRLAVDNPTQLERKLSGEQGAPSWGYVRLPALGNLRTRIIIRLIRTRTL